MKNKKQYITGGVVMIIFSFIFIIIWGNTTNAAQIWCGITSFFLGVTGFLTIIISIIEL